MQAQTKSMTHFFPSQSSTTGRKSPCRQEIPPASVQGGLPVQAPDVGLPGTQNSSGIGHSDGIWKGGEGVTTERVLTMGHQGMVSAGPACALTLAPHSRSAASPGTCPLPCPWISIASMAPSGVPLSTWRHTARDGVRRERHLSAQRRFCDIMSKPGLLTEPALRQSSGLPVNPPARQGPTSSINLSGGKASTTALTLGPKAAALTDFAAPRVQGGYYILLGGHDELLRALRGLQGGEFELPHVLLPPARGNGSAGEMGPGAAAARRARGLSAGGGTPGAHQSNLPTWSS